MGRIISDREQKIPYADKIDKIARTVCWETQKAIGVTQKDLALSSGTGLRFIIDLERGKPTCQIGKVFHILQNLGVRVEVTSPVPFQPEKTQ